MTLIHTLVLSSKPRTDMLIQYVRKGHGGKRVGVMVASKDANGVIRIASCKWKASDHYDPAFGLNVAKKRWDDHRMNYTIAASMVSDIEAFKDRVAKYYRVLRSCVQVQGVQGTMVKGNIIVRY